MKCSTKILIFSKSEEEHNEHLTILFERLNDFGITINLKKCKFGRKEVRLLDHIYTPKEVLSANEKIKAIRNIEQTRSMKCLRRFSSMAQSYTPSIPNLSRVLASLYDLMRKKNSIKMDARIN